MAPAQLQSLFRVGAQARSACTPPVALLHSPARHGAKVMHCRVLAEPAKVTYCRVLAEPSPLVGAAARLAAAAMSAAAVPLLWQALAL